MSKRIAAHTARTQFGQVMDRAVNQRERFIVDRRGEPVVVILPVEDYLSNVHSAPDWLREAWKGSKKRGLDKLSADAINTEIDDYRRSKRSGKK
ncbi:MAG: type II toxin-antitoxin system Phd/YefM family antitoxin [Terracidiphilus sp.]